MTAPGSDPADRAGQDITEQLLGQPRALRRRDVSRGAEVSLLSARKFWHALGFPVIDTDDELFTEADRQALATVAGIVREGLLDETTALAMTRAFARSADRLAGWQSQLIAEAVEAEDPRGRGEHDVPAACRRSDGGRSTNAPAAPESRSVPGVATAAETARRLAELTDRLEPLLVYAWRRHLSATVSRMMADADPESFGLTKQRSVGFADLVNFTALVRRLSERDLARLVSALRGAVGRRHHRPRRAPHQDGRRRGALHDRSAAAPAAAIALDLVDTMTEDDVLPDVRCGMARGPIISRLGDVFGTTVNRASRLTAVAPARARCSSTRRWPASSRACRASSSPASAAACCAASGPSPRACCAAPRARPPHHLTDPHAVAGADQGEPVCRPAPPSCASTVSSCPVSSTWPRSCSTVPRR